MKTNQIRASQQGDLDSLCGVYSLINTVAYLYDGRVNRHRLKSTLVSSFQDKWPLEELLEYGMTEQQMEYLITVCLRQGYYHKRYPLSFRQPYINQKKLRTLKIIDEIEVFLQGDHIYGCRLVMLATSTHWTLVKRTDHNFLYFFDSIGAHKAFKRSFSLRAGVSLYQLIPESIYFIERSAEM
jgi:hypothetical protein